MARHLLDDAGESAAHDPNDGGPAFGPAERMLAYVLLTLFALLGLTVTLVVTVMVIRVFGGSR